MAIDPGFARAWVGLYWARYTLSGYIEDTPEQTRTRQDGARRAVELDPADAEARVALATVYGDQEDLTRAEAEFDQALRLSPNSADLLSIYADWAYNFAKSEAGVEAAERARRLNPNTPQWAFSNFSRAYSSVGRYDEALRMLNHVPREAYLRNDLAYRAAALGALGRTVEARVAVAETLARHPRLTVEWAAWWWGLDEAGYRRLLETLRQAGYPLCATQQEVNDVPERKRLPECSTERASAAAPKT